MVEHLGYCSLSNHGDWGVSLGVLDNLTNILIASKLGNLIVHILKVKISIMNFLHLLRLKYNPVKVSVNAWTQTTVFTRCQSPINILHIYEKLSVFEAL